jgi:hypothetical protein
LSNGWLFNFNFFDAKQFFITKKNRAWYIQKMPEILVCREMLANLSQNCDNIYNNYDHLSEISSILVEKFEKIFQGPSADPKAIKKFLTKLS